MPAQISRQINYKAGSFAIVGDDRAGLRAFRAARGEGSLASRVNDKWKERDRTGESGEGLGNISRQRGRLLLVTAKVLLGGQPGLPGPLNQLLTVADDPLWERVG